MRQVKENNYEKDLYKWAFTQASLLKSKNFEKIDLKNIIEEIESLGKSQRMSLKSQMIRIVMHLLKCEYQSEKHSKSWDRSIGNGRIEIEKIIQDNPSLKRQLKDILDESYPLARKKAHVETGIEIKIFPLTCPWSLKEVIGE